MSEVRDGQPLASSVSTAADNTVLPSVDWSALLECIEQSCADDFPVSTEPQALVLSLAAPFRGWMQRRLHSMLQQLEFASSQQQVWHAAVQEYVDSRLSGWLSKIAIYELNLARQQQLLSGDSPEARYQFYLCQLQQSTVLEHIYEKYQSHMARVLHHFQLFAGFLQQVLPQVMADAGRIRQQFDVELLPHHIAIGKGDSHFGAHQVIEFRCASGTLYYKPRSLRSDLLYAELISRLNQQTGLQLRASQNLDCGDYGWQLHEATVQLSGLALCQRFYHSVGAHLALMRLLQISDIHYDNMLTSVDGEPVFYDLETAFSNGGNAILAADKVYADIQLQLLQQICHSVIQSGMLPVQTRFYSGLHALTQIEEVDSLVKSDQLQNAGRDDMHLSKVLKQMPVRSHLPLLAGQRSKPLDFITELEQGFLQVWQWQQQDRDWIYQCLQQYSDLQARYVLRHTALYAMFLAESCHPLYARDVDSLQALLNKLRIQCQHQPELTATVADEIRQLWQLDIPAYRGAIEGTDVCSQFGQYPFFQQSAFNRSCHALLQQDDFSLQVQLQLIRRSLQVPPPEVAAPAASVAELIPQLSELLRSQMFTASTDQSVSFLMTSLPEAGGGVWPMALDLYHGLSGMLLVCCALERRAGAVWQAATDAMQQQLQLLVQQSLADSRPFVGAPGTLWALAQSAILRRQPALLQQCVDWFCDADFVAATDEFDLIDGLAGLLLCQLSLYQHCAEPRLAVQMQAAVRKLQTLAQQDDNGCYWQSKQGQGLCSFSHGGGGVAYALLRYAAHVADSTARQTGLAALRYEDARFAPEAQNWPDLRADVQQKYNLTWCNGLSGHLLARSRDLYLLSEQQQQQFTAALSYFATQSVYLDHSVCHGLAGALLVSLHLPAAQRQLSQQLASYLCQQRPLQTGSGYDAGDLSLMTGFGGILYSLLRLDDPLLPCPLTLGVQ